MHKDVLDYLLKVDLVEEVDESEVSQVSSSVSSIWLIEL